MSKVMAWGDASLHKRYALKIPIKRGRKRQCGCGCNNPETHLGMANGVCLMSGCQLSVRRWVKELTVNKNKCRIGGDIVKFERVGGE